MGTGRVGLHGDCAQLHVVVEFNLKGGHAQTHLLGMEGITVQEMTPDHNLAIVSIVQVWR